MSDSEDNFVEQPQYDQEFEEDLKKKEKKEHKLKEKRSKRKSSKLEKLEEKYQDFRAEDHIRSYTSYCPQTVGFVYSVIMWETYFVVPFWLCAAGIMSLVFKIFNAAPIFSALCICLGTYFLYELAVGPELQKRLGKRPKSTMDVKSQSESEHYENAVKTLTNLYTHYLRAAKVLNQQKAQNSFIYMSQSIASLAILAFIGANVQTQSLVFIVMGIVAVVPGFVGRFLKTDDPNDTTYQCIVKTLRKFSEKREKKETKENK